MAKNTSIFALYKDHNLYLPKKAESFCLCFLELKNEDR